MEKFDYKNIWVYIEHCNGCVSDVSLELCCELRKLCDISGDKLIAVYTQPLAEKELSRVKDCGIDGIIAVSGSGYERYNTEAYTELFTKLCRKHKPSAVFVGGTVNGRDFAPRFAARLETGCTSDATELVYDKENGHIEFIEPAAGGKIMAVITIPQLRPQVGTVRPGTFKHIPCGTRSEIEVIEEQISFDIEKIGTQLVEFREAVLSAEFDIKNSDAIVCVGNGIKDESLDKYRELASLLGAKLACTRPVVDRELLPFALQVGQTGVMIKPKLYISFGVSGAVNHVIGVDADKFIAVNKDAGAPIFNYCDIGIVGDMDEVCDAMIAVLK